MKTTTKGMMSNNRMVVMKMMITTILLDLQLDALERWAGQGSAPSVRVILPGHGRIHETGDFVSDLQGVCRRMKSRMEEGSLLAAHTEN